MAKLESTESYREASHEERHRVANGCGPQGAANLVPNQVMGANFKGACLIHDWDYTQGETRRDEADARFFRNLRSSARAAPRHLRPFALIAAWWYYRAVRLAGGMFYSVNDT